MIKCVFSLQHHISTFRYQEQTQKKIWRTGCKFLFFPYYYYNEFGIGSVRYLVSLISDQFGI
jgi:hypothetical protein